MHVPEGWKTYFLSEVTKEKVSYGIVQAGPHVEEGMPYIKSSDVGGKIIVSSLQKTSKEIHYKYRRSSVHPGDIVFSLRGNIGEISIVPDSLPEANLTQGTARISVAVKHDRFFIYHQLSSERVRSRINKLSKGSTFKEISLEALRKVQIPIAPIQEQQKIAQILSTWDKAIEKLEALIAAKQKRKKALMQQLLTGKNRFAEFDEEWKAFHLAELFKERNETGHVDLNLLSITREKGVIPRDEVERKDTSNDDKSKYLRICPGDIGYNTMRMWQGVSALSTLEGIISPAYTVCIPTAKIDGKFVSYLFKSTPTVHLFQRYSQGLTSDTWNLKFHHFGEIKVFIPLDIKEQQKIASVLSTADTEIQIHQKQLAALKQQKKGLMQQLLTGKKRVKVDGDV